MIEELSEVLRQKEVELAQLHKEIQALRLVANLLSERREVNLMNAVPGNVKPMSQNIDALASQLLSPAAAAAPVQREINGSRLPATASYSGTISQTNGSTKQFP